MPDQVLTDIIKRHLPYEIRMLRSTYQQLALAAKIDPQAETPQQTIVRHALIESFCVHARALLDFFSNIRRHKTDAVAADFTDGYNPTFDVDAEPLLTLRRKLNKEIFHLTMDRPTLAADRFDAGKDGRIILQIIEDAIARFKECLTADFQDFECGDVIALVGIQQFATATNTVTMIGLSVDYAR